MRTRLQAGKPAMRGCRQHRCRRPGRLLRGGLPGTTAMAAGWAVPARAARASLRRENRPCGDCCATPPSCAWSGACGGAAAG